MFYSFPPTNFCFFFESPPSSDFSNCYGFSAPPLPPFSLNNHHLFGKHDLVASFPPEFGRFPPRAEECSSPLLMHFSWGSLQNIQELLFSFPRGKRPPLAKSIVLSERIKVLFFSGGFPANGGGSSRDPFSRPLSLSPMEDGSFIPLLFAHF